MVMSAFLGLLAMTIVFSSFYVMRTWSYWLTVRCAHCIMCIWPHRLKRAPRALLLLCYAAWPVPHAHLAPPSPGQCAMLAVVCPPG